MGRMLITGASKGIGAATALAAAEAGWDVAVTYSSDHAGAASVGRAVEAMGRRVLVVPLDVSDDSAVDAVFDRLASKWGGLDCLVNNAGIAPGYGNVDVPTVAELERTWAVNITGPFLCARRAVAIMATDLGGSGGSIVNVSSKAAVLGGPNEWIHYAASKGAVDTFTVGLAKEVALRGIRVNGVRPGLIEGGSGEWAPVERVQSMAPGVPMGRPAAPSEIAAAIVWLASEAASYVTGAIVDVTGGR